MSARRDTVRYGAAMLLLLLACTPFTAAHAILAGDEFALPTDSPSNRIDPFDVVSPFNFVGALQITSGSQSFVGSASVLSPHWVLTAGHNVDINDDGNADAGLSVTLHLSGLNVYSSAGIIIQPDFTGFGNPSIHNDLALLYFDDALPDLNFPVLGLNLNIGDEVTLAGYGRSGYGNYGYTTAATLSDRRIGYNTIESFSQETDGNGLLYRYDFDSPDSPLSLGNDRETIIGPGDSGGPMLLPWYSGHALVGVNTFTEGFGGRFGDVGGGVALEPYWDWIAAETGLPLVPEPHTLISFLLGIAFFSLCRLNTLRRML